MVQGACFIDADNIPTPEGTEWGATLEGLLDSSCKVRRAYGAGKTQSATLSRWLFKYGFDQTNAYSPVSGKNTADIQMTLAIAETALTSSEPMRFIIATGDSDFAPVLQKLFKWGHEVYLVTRAGHLLTSAESLGIHTVMIASSAPQLTSAQSTATIAHTGEHPTLEGVERFCVRELTGGGEVQLVTFAHTLNRQFGVRWYEPLGYKRLTDAINSLSSLKVTQVAGGDYVVHLRSGAQVSSAPPEAEAFMTGQPSPSALIELIKELYAQGDRHTLPYIHHAIRKAYPDFTYVAYGHSKFTSFVRAVFPHLEPESDEHHARWFERSEPVVPSAVSLVSPAPLDPYVHALAIKKILIPSPEVFSRVCDWLTLKGEFQGPAATATLGAEELSLPKGEVRKAIQALYKAQLFEIQAQEGLPTVYRLSSSPEESWRAVKDAFRRRLSEFEPLNEASWEALWSASPDLL